MSIAEKLTTIAENQQKVYDAGYTAGQEQGGGGYDEGYTDGQKAEYDRFWDAYQENGNRTNYVEAFTRSGWNVETYNPKYPIIGVTYGLQSLFSNAHIVDTKVPITLRGGGQMAATFNFASWLKRIALLILEIPALTTANTFSNCVALEEINIECVGDGCIAADVNISMSSKLTSASVDSIINALQNLTGQTAKKVQFHTDVLLKLTDEQIAAMTAKNWIM